MLCVQSGDTVVDIMGRKASQTLLRYRKQRQRNVLAQPGPLPFIVVLDHLKAGFNVPKIFRSAQAFGARELHLVGIGPFDPAAAKGAFKAVPARFYDDFAASYEDLKGRGYRLFVLQAGCPDSLMEAVLPERAAFVFGHEEMGVSFDPADYPDIGCLSIPQVGPMDSLNVSVAASVVMYEYRRQHAPVAE
jgi:tRNA G18 (ribose-2'-O)-methylase SpoU